MVEPTPSEKYARQTGFMFPKVRDENKKYEQNHHPEVYQQPFCRVATFVLNGRLDVQGKDSLLQVGGDEKLGESGGGEAKAPR